MDTQPPNPSLSRKEARDRLRRAAAHSDQAGADWIEQHPYESLSFALMIGWLLARYPRIGRTLIRLLAR